MLQLSVLLGCFSSVPIRRVDCLSVVSKYCRRFSLDSLLGLFMLERCSASLLTTILLAVLGQPRELLSDVLVLLSTLF